jgi:hypothetical protein
MLKPGQDHVYETRAEVLEGSDVVVAGGGTAGIAAALAASRNGAKVTLVERSGSLGGMLTAGNAGITMFTKFSGKPEEHAADVRTLATNPSRLHVAGGIPMEIAKRLLDAGFGIGNEGTVGSYLFTSSEDFKRVLFEMMEESKVGLRLHSLVTGVVKTGDSIEGIVVESKSGRQIIPAKQCIDATGDGDVAALAGAPCKLGVTEDDLCAKDSTIGQMHPMGVMFKAGNVELGTTIDWLEKNTSHFEKQPFARFTLPEVKERFSRREMATFNVVRSGETPERFQVYNLPNPGVVTLCCPSVGGRNGCDVVDLTHAERTIAALVARWMASIRKVPGFEKSFLLQVPEMGVRETRHVQGDYLLNIEDIFHQREFQDCIGFGAHPIDTRPRPQWLQDPETAYPPRWFFQIPYRSLIAKGISNLLVAGRCISATHEAFGCIRPTVQCMITGEAAGTAAALCAVSGTALRALGYEKLRERLKERGVAC